MAIEVQIRRVTKAGIDARALLPYIIKLRSYAVAQPGYISGETLFNLEQSDECLVVSRWITLEHWQKWNRTSIRIKIDESLQEFLDKETEYKIYGIGLW